MTEPLENSAGGRTGGSRARRRRAFLPTALVGTLSLTLTLGTAITGSGQARAQDDGGFSNGIAKAHAQVMQVAPGVGNFNLGIKSGTSTSEVVNALAQAQSQTLNLGLIGTSLTAQQCDGSDGVAQEEDLPQPTQVDNREGDASATHVNYPIIEGALGGGRQTASATEVPSAHATVQEVAGALGPLATVSGGRSDAITRIVDGEAREALATSSADLGIAEGAVQLSGMQWRAFHRTGAGPAKEGSFTFAGGSAGGVPLSADDLGAAEDAINTALVPSGVTVALPEVVERTEPTDLVRVSPLRITLRDSPAGKALLGPGLNLTRVQREQLFDEIVAVYCKAAAFLLVGDITVSIASGTGFLILEVGGAEARTAELELFNPFGELKPFTPPVPAAPLAPTPAAGAAGAPAVPAPAPAAPPTPTQPIASGSDGPFERLCESLHPSEDGCTSGMALALGLAGAALTAGVGYLDWWRQRRYAAELAAETAS